MYAVISTGGKQYTVKPGDVIQVEKLNQDLGAQFEIKDVLLVGGEATHVGQPLVKNAAVTVVVTKQAKTRKVTVFKKKRRQSYRKHNTHRQEFTELFVVSIAGPDGKSAKADSEPVVRDMAKVRTERIETKKADARARRENKGEDVKVEAKKAAPKKKVAKKATAKKKTAKAGGAKKKVAKKAAKKTK